VNRHEEMTIVEPHRAGRGDEATGPDGAAVHALATKTAIYRAPRVDDG
jgi:hypothetical protein